MTDSLLHRLAAIVGEQHVAVAHSEPGRHGGPVAAQHAPLIVRPSSAEEIAHLIEAAREREASLAVRDAPRRDGGARQAILVDMGRMTRVLRLDETSLVVHAETGIPAGELEAVLSRRGLTLGPFPAPLFELSLGALLARRRPDLASAQGPFCATCLGVSAVLANGQIVHTRVAPRHAAGPDVVQLLLGSEGRLGILTAAFLRVQRIPEARHLVSFVFPSLLQALDAGIEGLRRGARLQALRVLGEHDARLLLEGEEEFGPAVPRGGALLVACAAGPKELAAAEARVLAEAAAARDGVDAGPRPATRWWRQRGGAQEASETGNRSATPGESLVLPMPLASLADAIAAANDTSRAHRAILGLSVGRLHMGGGCLVASFGGSARHRERARLALVEALAPFAEGQDGPLLRATESLCAVLDPAGTFRPALEERAPC